MFDCFECIFMCVVLDNFYILYLYKECKYLYCLVEFVM